MEGGKRDGLEVLMQEQQETLEIAKGLDIEDALDTTSDMEMLRRCLAEIEQTLKKLQISLDRILGQNQGVPPPIDTLPIRPPGGRRC